MIDAILRAARRAARIALAASLLAVAPRAAASVTVTTAPASVPSCETAAVSATIVSASTVASVRLWFSLSGATDTGTGWNFQKMVVDPSDSEVYTGFIPVLPAGTLSWYVEAEYVGGETEVSATQTTTISDQLTYDRFHDMRMVSGSTESTFYTPVYGWRQSGGSMSTNFYANAPNGTQWKAQGVAWARANTLNTHVPRYATSGSIANLGTGLTFPILYFLNVDPDSLLYIRTPRLDGGLGTFSFNARNVAGTTSKIMLQVAFTTGEPSESNWRNVEEYSLPSAGANYTFSTVVNNPSVTYARIVRTAINTAASGNYAYRTGVIGIDNICATLPSPDVSMRELMHNPGYPSIGEDVLVRCVVSNLNVRIPAINPSVTACYKWASSADASVTGWAETNLTYIGESEGGLLFEGMVPAQAQAGYLHYYLRCDFDGYFRTSKAGDGMPTPEYLYGTGTTTTPPTAAPPHLVWEVRSFKSRYGVVRLQQTLDGGAPVYYDMSLVGDNQWQVTAPVPAGTVTRAFFVGREGYAEGADAYNILPFFYGDTDQMTPYETPTGGRPERSYGVTNGLAPIRIDVASEGYLLYRLDDSVDDTALGYTIKRGVFQDFNDWVADADYYANSLYGSSIGVHEDSFNDWVAPFGWRAVDNATEDFVYQTVESEFNSAEDQTYWDWYRTGVRIANERITNSVAVNPVFGGPQSNIVAQVKVGGRIRNTALSSTAMPPGVGTVSARLRSAIDDGAFAIYDDHGWEYSNTEATELLVEAAFSIPAESRPFSKYYASVVVDYRDENNYHEVRYGRMDANDVNDQRAFLETWRCLNGTLTRLAHWDTSANAQVKGTGDIVLKVRLRRTAATSKRTQIAAGLKIGTWTVWGSYNASVNDGVDSDLYLGGKVGFGAYDCTPNVKYLKVTKGTSGASYNATSGAAATGFDTTFSATAGDWTLGGIDTTATSGSNVAYHWFFDSADSYVLKRRVPRTVVNLYTAPYSGSEEPPAASRYSYFDSVTVDSLQYITKSWTLHEWSPTFIDMRIADRADDKGEGYVVCDYISLSPWRASSRGPDEQFAAVIPTGTETLLPCYEWTTEDHQYRWYNANPNNWLVLEGWAVTNSAASPPSVQARFQRSQANTNIVQALVSPLLTNGIGTVRFDYRVVGDGVAQGQVVYAVEYTERSNIRGWGNTAAIFTNYVNESGFHSCEIGVNYGEGVNARLRIRILEGSDPDVVLWIDNAYVNDSPPEASDMWKVYNGCVTHNGFGDSTRVFGGAGKSLYLNDAVDADLVPRQEDPLDAHLPYLQAPGLPEGVGEVSFMYRTYSATKPGFIAIDVCADEHAPDDQWRNITNFVVSGTGYVKFEDPMIYQPTNYFMRIHSSTNGTYGRVCIDNVLVTEPSRASYEISRVWLSPLQPVVSPSNVVVNATISREMQNPTGIRLFASYKVSTNNWGYANWWHPGMAGTVELLRVGTSSTFQSPAGLGLPSTPANGTVQYVVWGIHDDIPADYEVTDVIFQKDDSFENPSWYGGVDLNVTHAECGFSPYYLIYSCAPGAVWINEVWSNYTSTEYYPNGPSDFDNSLHNPAYEFVELAGKSGVDVSGWKFRVYNKNNAAIATTYTIPSGTTIPNDASGWGFLVLGDDGCPNVDVTISDAGKSGTSNTRDFFFSGASTPIGMELVRDGGIVEQQVYVGRSKTAMSAVPSCRWINGNPEFTSSQYWKGSSTKGLSYSLMDAPGQWEVPYTNYVVATDGDFKIWYWRTAYPTPGAPNAYAAAGDHSADQTFAPVVVSSYLLSSVISSGAAYGTQNGVTTEINIEVDSGASTSIVYVAGSWYKIVALTSNGTPVPDAVGQSSYTFNASDLSGDVANEVSFGPKTSTDYASETDPARRWSDAILNWFRARGWSESAIDAGDGDAFSVQQEYLLDTDPTLFTVVTNVTQSISVAGDVVTLGLGLTRLDAGQPVTRSLNGAVGVYGSAALGANASWTRINAASLPVGAFSGTTSESTSFDASALGLRFFRWTVEE